IVRLLYNCVIRSGRNIQFSSDSRSVFILEFLSIYSNSHILMVTFYFLQKVYYIVGTSNMVCRS
ncbi:hypothetical protein L9F63_027659, partial [Diploptera punctata]